MFFITMFVVVLFFFVCLFVLFSILNCSKSVKGDHEIYCFFITPSFSEPTREICPAGNCRANKVINVDTRNWVVLYACQNVQIIQKRDGQKLFFHFQMDCDNNAKKSM